MRNVVIIVGHGKLAATIMSGLPGYLEDFHIDYWESVADYEANRLIVVHIGSGRQLPDVINFCNANKVPLIQGSTGVKDVPKECDFTFIDAPNLSLLMLKFMYMLKEYGALFKEYDILITESHQSTKKTVPGTAIEIANSLGVAADKIKSVRDRDEQVNRYGISRDTLSLHAFHSISIQDESTNVTFNTVVEGHDSYIKGLSKIISALHHLDNQYYHILDLIERKYL